MTTVAQRQSLNLPSVGHAPGSAGAAQTAAAKPQTPLESLALMQYLVKQEAASLRSDSFVGSSSGVGGLSLSKEAQVEHLVSKYRTEGFVAQQMPRPDYNRPEVPSGFSSTRATPSERQQTLQELGSLINGLRDARTNVNAYYEQNPTAHMPTDGEMTLHQIINSDSMSTVEISIRVFACAVHDHPEIIDEIGAGDLPGADQIVHGPGNGQAPVDGIDAPGGAAPGQQAGGGGDFMKGLLGFLGQAASFLGPILMVAGPVVAAILAATGVGAPVAAVILAALPVVGMAMSAGGPMLTQLANGEEVGGMNADSIGALIGGGLGLGGALTSDGVPFGAPPAGPQAAPPVAAPAV